MRRGRRGDGRGAGAPRDSVLRPTRWRPNPTPHRAPVPTSTMHRSRIRTPRPTPHAPRAIVSFEPHVTRRIGRMRVRVGTSGYAYKEWKGTFYPSDLKAADFLSYYATRLKAVEINNTF